MAKAKESGAAKAKVKEAPSAKAKPKVIAKPVKIVAKAAAKVAAKVVAPASKPAVNGKSKEAPKAPVKKDPPTGKVVAAAAKIKESIPAAKAKEAAPSAKAKEAAPAAKAKEETKKTNGKPLNGKASAQASNGRETAGGRDKSATTDRYKDVRENGKPLVGLKCPFPADELSKWRQALLERRSEITSDIAGLVKDAMEAEDGHTTPNHIAERGSDADLQDMSLGMAGDEEEILWQIDRALRKIDQASPIPFGLCEYTRESIPRSRLQLLPWTPLSIEGAQHMEDSRLTLEDMLLDD